MDQLEADLEVSMIIISLLEGLKTYLKNSLEAEILSEILCLTTMMMTLVVSVEWVALEIWVALVTWAWVKWVLEDSNRKNKARKGEKVKNKTTKWEFSVKWEVSAADLETWEALGTLAFHKILMTISAILVVVDSNNFHLALFLEVGQAQPQ